MAGYNDLQNGSTSFLQGGTSMSNTGGLTVQSAGQAPQGGGSATINQGGSQPNVLGASTVANVDTNTAIDPAAAAAAAKAAEDAAKAAQLRGQITDLVNTVKSLFNARYGNAEQAAAEQSGNLVNRFTNESQDLTKQIGQQTELAGAGAAANGVFDSSYRGNNQDQITQAGQSQIRDLGQELSDNQAAIGGEVLKQKSARDANNSSMDKVLQHLAESTDVNELTSLRNTIDAKIAETQAGGSDYATKASSLGALDKIAPSSTRAVQLKTTLAKIVGGNAPSSQKAAVGQQLISSAGLDPADAQRLLLAFQADLGSTPEQQQPTA